VPGSGRFGNGPRTEGPMRAFRGCSDTTRFAVDADAHVDVDVNDDVDVDVGVDGDVGADMDPEGCLLAVGGACYGP
jgi:hypothetical protein